MTDPTVAISITARSGVEIFTVFDLTQMLARTRTANVYVNVWQGGDLPTARQCLVDMMLGNPTATHMLWLDADMRVPPDTIDRLLAHDLELVGANYPQRQAAADRWAASVTSEDRTGLERVELLPFGATLVSRAVFEKIDKPWFATPWDEDLLAFWGEDKWFTTIAADAGFEAFVDHDLSQDVRHIGAAEFGTGPPVQPATREL